MSINNVSAVSDALKYINGQDIETKSTSITQDVKNSVSSPLNLLFGGMEATGAIKTATNQTGLIDAFKNIGSIPSSSNTIGDAVNFYTTKADLARQASAAKKAAAATQNTGKVAQFFNAVKGGLGKVLTPVKNLLMKIPGAQTVTTGAKGLLGKFSNSTVGKICKGTGATGIMIINGIIGLGTEVIPAFVKGGPEAGFKQLGKTAVNTVGTGAGWAGGQVAGRFIGGAIGTIFGPAGTAVGQAIGGFVGGIIGSAVGAGVAKKITGKSELEKLEDKQYETAATQVVADQQALQELNALVAQQVQTEIQNGTADDDTERMAKYLNSGAFSTFTGAPVNNNQYDVNQNQQYDYNQTQEYQQPQTYQQPQASNYVNYWTQMANKIQQGDTSIYSISDEKLDSMFKPAQSNSTTNPMFHNDLQYDDEKGRVNYFAIG